MLHSLKRLVLFVLAMILMVGLVLVSALLLRDPQLRPVFFGMTGLLLLVAGLLGVAVSMRRGLLVEVGLGVIATAIGGLLLLAAQPWQARGV